MADYFLSSRQRHNFKHLYLDVMWWGVLAGSTIAFISVYLARLGASAFQLALLAAGPALINLGFALPAGHWMKGRNLLRTTLVSSVFFRFGYLLLIFLPWVFVSAVQIWVVILIYLLAAFPGAVLAISFNALFAELVDVDYRPMVVGRRNAILSASLILTSLVVGVLLDHLPYPLNYQLVFGLGALGAGLSSSHLFRLKPDGMLPAGDRPIRSTLPLRDTAAYGMFRSGDVFRRGGGLRYITRFANGKWLRLDLVRGPFGLFLLAYLAFYTAQYLPTSLFPIYFVNDLMLADGVISLGTALFYFSVLVISFRLPLFERKWGKVKILAVGVIAYAVFPLLVSVWGTAFGVLLAHVLGGLAWGFAGTSTLNHLMEVVPADDRPAHMALNHITMNLGILLGSFLGPVLGQLVGVRLAIFLAGVFRVVAGGMVVRRA